MPAEERPLFLINALWRTGSTYIWKKFRDHGAYHCYYEPFHESLSAFTREAGQNDLVCDTPALLRHPPLDRPYLDEYPCRRSGGAELYSKWMAYEQYCLDERQSNPALHAYVQHLIDHAAGLGKTALLQPNRALLRSRWLCANFPFVHVFLTRNRWDVWRSMQSFENLYFISMILCIISQNQRHPLFQPLVAAAPICYFRDEDPAREADYFQKSANELGSRAFIYFSYFYTLTTAYNAAFADLVIDMDRLSGDRSYQSEVERRFAAYGANLDFSDCRLPRHPAPLDMRRDVLQEANQMDELARTVCRSDDTLRLAPHVNAPLRVAR
ncbi:MAG TPA: hypothetical protein VMZ52_10645 [Bryobacteraceae bacterium]|nr:hypothetical protein [Bryobacteraceae bacterium]